MFPQLYGRHKEYLSSLVGTDFEMVGSPASSSAASVRGRPTVEELSASLNGSKTNSAGYKGGQGSDFLSSMTLHIDVGPCVPRTGSERAHMLCWPLSWDRLGGEWSLCIGQ